VAAAAAADAAVTAAAAAAAVVVTAVTVVAETAGDSTAGAGSESWLLLECFQLLIALKSSAHQSITHIQWFRATRLRLRCGHIAAQILPMTACQVPMKAVQCA
jgi:hypothetical protein